MAKEDAKIVAANGLTPRQEQAARMIFMGQLPKKEIARLCGVTPKTISEWQKIPEFLAFMDSMGEAHGSYVEALLLDGETEAVNTLRAALSAVDGKGRPHWEARLKAAIRLLDAAGQRGLPTQKIKQENTNITGDLGEMLKTALADPGIKQMLASGQLRLPALPAGAVPPQEVPYADYEVMDD